MAGWQPIATAPRDGTIIDVWVDTYRLAFRDHTGCRYTYAQWIDRDGGGWAVYNTDIDDYEWVEEEDLAVKRAVTHWMPLPGPP